MNRRRTFLLAAATAPLGMVLANTAVAADGQPLDLEGYRGKIVLADFWASWCGPCRLSMPWLNEMHARYAGEGLRVLGINLDENSENAQQFLREVPADFDIVYDPKGQHAAHYALETMPSSILFDRQGTLRYRHNGFLSSETAEYEKRIVSMLRA